MNKPTRGKTNKISKTKCSPIKCLHKEHGDQICEAIRKPGSSNDHSICYITELCDAFCSALDSDGRSALHTAALVGKCKVVHYLATHGANVNLQDGINLHTPLHCAILSGNMDTTLILLKYGADTKIPDKHGITPANCVVHEQPLKHLHPHKAPVLQGFSWGINANYNLGLVSAHAREAPEYVEVPLRRRNILSSISMNKFHTVFLSTYGKIFVCGHGHGGRLGFETNSSVIIPQYVKISNYRIRSISAGVDHTLFLNMNNEILSCGMNKYHQLGFVPAPSSIFTPQILKQWHAKHPTIKVLGVAAGAYHSVIWSKEEVFTCGINAGQLGHADIHNETFVDLPKSINYIKNLDKCKVGEIVDVVVSDGATVVVTSLGNVIACYEHKTHFIPLRVESIKKIASSGGIIDTSIGINLLSDHKNEDVKIAILVMNGNLFVWSKKFSLDVQKDGFEVWDIQGISNFCLNSQNLCLVDTHGEVYFGHLEEQISVSSREKIFESHNYQYFYSKGVNCIKSIIKGKRVSHLYRTHSVFCDPKGNNFIALQYDPRLFLKRRVSRISNSLRQDISDYYTKVVDFNSNYDVEIVVGNRCFPAHSYVLSYNSDYFYERLTDCLNQNDYSKATEESLKLRLDDTDADIFEEVLSIMYFHKHKNGRFDEPDRFVRYTSEKDIENWRMVNFIHLHRKGDHEISETMKKSRHLKDGSKAKGSKKDSLKYPLKSLKELSCALKIKDLQEILLLTNTMDLENEGVNQPSLLSEIYAPTLVYDRKMFPEFWDMSFKCEDGVVVKAHKFILMARSSYFDALLGFRWNQDRGSDVVDISIPSNILIPLLDFLYTNHSPVVFQSNDLDFLCKILMFSHRYLIEGLHMLCQISLFKCLTLKNCFDLLKFCVVYDALSLKEVILEFICLNLPYFLDSRVLKDLDEGTIMAINATYQEVVLSSESLIKDKEASMDEHQFLIAENPDTLIDSSRTELDFTEDPDPFDEFYYIPKKTSNIALRTNIQTISLPSQEDLEIALNNNSYIVHQTPEDWVEEFKDFGNLSPDKREPNNERKRRSSSHKKRTRKHSSSAQVSSSSNSESEYAHELEDSSEPFSFEDLEDRVPKNSPHIAEEWEVVGENKHETARDPDVESDFKNLKIQTRQKRMFSSQLDQSSTKLSDENFSILNNAPFPTLNEAMTMRAVPKALPLQFTRLPVCHAKRTKKCKKSPSNPEEQKPPSPIPCAWGLGSPEKDSSLLDIMRRESTTVNSLTPKSSGQRNLSSSQAEQLKDLTPVGSQPLKRRISEEELCHWNPITRTIVESPREASDVSFSSIVEEEITYTKHVEFQRNKPLSLIQLEEKAIKELFEFYGGEFNPEERITVTRCGINPVNPSWNIQGRHE